MEFDNQKNKIDPLSTRGSSYRIIVEYILDNIKKVMRDYGPRDAGSKGETKAQKFIKEELSKYVDEVQMEPFEVAPKAFMGFCPVIGNLLFVSIITYWFYPLIALILDIVAVLVIFQEFIRYKLFLDPFFPKRTSHNVWGIKKPEGEVKR